MRETAPRSTAPEEAGRLAAALLAEEGRVRRLRERLGDQARRLAALRQVLDRNREQARRLQAALSGLRLRRADALAGIAVELGDQRATLRRLEEVLARQVESRERVRAGIRDSRILARAQRDDLERRFRPR